MTYRISMPHISTTLQKNHCESTMKYIPLKKYMGRFFMYLPTNKYPYKNMFH